MERIDNEMTFIHNGIPLEGRIDEYGLIRPLGEGSYGSVYTVIDTQSNKFYAMKIFLNPNECR